jgi:hypothetical protein
MIGSEARIDDRDLVASPRQRVHYMYYSLLAAADAS